MITLPLTVLVGLLLGIVLARFVPSSSEVPSLRLGSRVRSALWPLLSLSIGLWLPAALCIYHESSDWSLMYLLAPERATPTVLAALFTILTASVPAGFMLSLLIEHSVSQRISVRFGDRRGERIGLGLAWGIAAIPLTGIVLLLALCPDRMFWVGSFADFHDGRWLLASLGRGSPRLLSVLLLTNSVVLAGAVITGRAIAARQAVPLQSGGTTGSPTAPESLS